MFIIIPPLLYSTHKILQFVGWSFWSGGKFFLKNQDYKLLWRQKMSEWQNQVSCEILELFPCLKIWVIKKSVFVFENIVFKLIWSHKRHMRGILW